MNPFGKVLRNSFISGLLLLAPVGVTLFVANFLVQRIGPPARATFFFFIPEDTVGSFWSELLLQVLAILLVTVLITALGWLSQKLIGRMAVNLFERLVSAVPGVRTVYNTVKQIRDTFATQDKAVFQCSVLVEYPRKDVYVLGFLTGEGKGEPQLVTAHDLVNVFIPTTPNPTSGFLLMVPRNEVIFLQMSVADGMKLIISGGAVVPSFNAAGITPPLPQ